MRILGKVSNSEYKTLQSSKSARSYMDFPRFWEVHFHGKPWITIPQLTPSAIESGKSFQICVCE